MVIYEEKFVWFVTLYRWVTRPSLLNEIIPLQCQNSLSHYVVSYPRRF